MKALYDFWWPCKMTLTWPNFKNKPYPSAPSLLRVSAMYRASEVSGLSYRNRTDSVKPWEHVEASGLEEHSPEFQGFELNIYVTTIHSLKIQGDPKLAPPLGRRSGMTWSLSDQTGCRKVWLNWKKRIRTNLAREVSGNWWIHQKVELFSSSSHRPG